MSVTTRPMQATGTTVIQGPLTNPPDVETCGSVPADCERCGIGECHGSGSWVVVRMFGWCWP